MVRASDWMPNSAETMQEGTVPIAGSRCQFLTQQSYNVDAAAQVLVVDPLRSRVYSFTVHRPTGSIYPNGPCSLRSTDASISTFNYIGRIQRRGRETESVLVEYCLERIQFCTGM